ncbi:hypothetical protein CH63R_06948 [Colletotrichum higginsianum IMI 349063]|uniref:Uncharacterized protein n=1 Tax=Colletotrichum higginsianum (strain IMI 349063) TaxID=759273 RepID=A0A1B7Y7Y7_COLHI|nr:hypothetical protein CH63R_06948 [Colletotrichum higginsianum IMI 349063]OBR08183.1 hypothetical protein CH63R_06948 [Colletotrichum higginsianum IMI 349063]
MSRNHEDATTAVPPLKSPLQPAPPKAARIYPTLSLLSVILLFLSAGAGIALSAIVLFRNLESTEVLDPLSRAVFFVASCTSLVYVVTHIVAARTAYIKNYGSPTVYGKYLAGFAFLLARLGLPVWVAAITLAIFVAVNVGLDLSKGVQQNIPWFNVIISIASLFSLGAVLAIIEMADRPFATLGFSQTWFILGEDTLVSPDEDDLESASAETAMSFHEKREDQYQYEEVVGSQEKRKRRTLIKKNPQEAQQRVLRHARSMSMPTPLNSVFSDQAGFFPPDSLQAFHTSFAWKPPTRNDTNLKIDKGETVNGWVTWQEHAHMQHAASNISTNASAHPDDVILPSMFQSVKYSPRNQSLLEHQRRYDWKRWTAADMQSPSVDGEFLPFPFPRPLTPLMTMEEERRIMSRGPSIIEDDWEATGHPRKIRSSRPASTHTAATSTSTRSGIAAKRETRPSLPHIATLATRVETPTNSIRPESNVLPNEGRRRRRISSVGLSEGRRLTSEPNSRTASRHASRPNTRPPNQRGSSVVASAPAQQVTSPTSTAKSFGSEVHNFSRPRTSAAARMQSKVAKRLRATKPQDNDFSGPTQTGEQILASPSTPGKIGSKKPDRQTGGVPASPFTCDSQDCKGNGCEESSRKVG